ncbi:MAG: type II toxin-antitoxin system death-on-curing family toxin [Chlamydiae bacterium]|nr:type II toxin-antitoxin system death-on-curing family toxin [Chlamydiota bacterium]MBI3266379.1 type II toxin-antitoxin system death-on-curing family toxin [Chlamydiota bacterium]
MVKPFNPWRSESLLKNILFLTLAEVIMIHNNQIELYGGRGGVQDMRLLESALAQPQAQFQGVWLHPDLFEMASAYAFHISQNHPFMDGNKRTALACALVFLEINGVSLLDPKQKLLGAAWRLAGGELNKKKFSDLLRSLPEE